MYLKLSFYQSKWVCRSFLSLTVLSKWVSGSSNFDTDFSLTVPNLKLLFFRLLNKKCNEDSKNVLKTVIFSLQVGFTFDFVSDCLFKLYF